MILSQKINKNIILRNWNVENEGYSNTGMDKPYFIVEIQDLFIKDIEYEFYKAIRTGREIEFSCNEKNYFASRNDREAYYFI